MKLIKLSLAAALAVTVSFAEETTSDLGVSANMAISSDYIWRGMTQNQNSPAFQGGIDLEYKGFYLGTWGSNVNFGDGKNSLEADLYAGFSNEVAGIGYDIGYIQYVYPNMAEDYNFAEAYFGLSKDFEVISVGATYYMGVKTDSFDAPDNIEVTASVPLPAEITFDAVYGVYDTIGSYYSAGLSKSVDKFDLSVAYTGFINEDSEGDDQSNLIATIGTSF